MLSTKVSTKNMDVTLEPNGTEVMSKVQDQLFIMIFIILFIIIFIEEDCDQEGDALDVVEMRIEDRQLFGRTGTGGPMLDSS